MENIKFTEYNKKILNGISNYFDLSNSEDFPIKMEINFYGTRQIGFAVNSLLEAIAVIGEHGKKQDLETCSELAKLAIKLIPHEHLQFVDDLLIKTKNNQEYFVKIEE